MAKVSDADIVAAARAAGVDPDFYRGIVFAESRGNTGLVSSKGARGPAQLMPDTARTLGVDINDPMDNLRGGAMYARQLLDQFGGDRTLAAAAYNAGPGAVQRHGGVPPFAETRAYVATVNGSGQDIFASDQGSSGADIFGDKPKPPGQPTGGPPPKVGPSGEDIFATPQQSQAAPPKQDQWQNKQGMVFSDRPGGQAGNPTQAQADAYQQFRNAPGFDPHQPLGSNQNPVVVAPWTKPADLEGKSYFDPAGNFTEPGPHNWLDSVARSDIPWISRYAAHVASRERDAGAAFRAGTDAQLRPAATFGDVLMNSPLLGGVANLNQARQAAGALGYVTAPVMGALDTFGGDPAAYALNRANEATGFSANEVNPERLTDIGSMFVPFGAEIAGERLLAQRAAKLGVSVDALRNAEAAAGAARPAARAPRIGPFPPKDVKAGQQLTAAAQDPGRVRDVLAGNEPPLIAGSQPTTAQLTGDPGLAALEQSSANRSQAGATAFAQRAQAQAEAQRGALAGVQPSGEPADVAKVFRSQLDEMDAQHEQAIATAQQRAQAGGAQVGGTATPQDAGARLRAVLTDAEQAARARENGLWTAIDPQGKLTGNLAGTRQAARDVIANEPATAAPMAGEEAAIFQTASNLPNIAPVRDLVALRGRVNDAMSTELRTNGRTATYARLAKLRGAIGDNLSTTIGDAVQADQAAVAAGQVSPADAIAAKLNDWVSNFQQRQQTVARAASEGSPGVATTGSASGGPGPDGAGLSPTGGSGSPAGNPSLPGRPTVDAGYPDRLAAATDATKTRARTFGVQPVSTITARAGASDVFKMEDGRIPDTVWRSGPGAYDGLQRVIAAGGRQTRGAIEDAAAMSLRKAAMREDGTLDPAKFARWQARYADALRALPPETAQQFADAASATRALDQAIASREAALSAFQKGTTGKLLGVTDPADVSRVVDSVLSSPTAASDMRALVHRFSGNADALSGLRRVVADNISARVVTADGTVNGAGLADYLKSNRAALSHVMTSDQMGTLDRLAADASRPPVSVGIPEAARKGSAVGGTLLDGLGGALGAGAGYAAGGAPASGIGGLVGVGAARFSRATIQALRDRGIASTQDLVQRALLDPQLARVLMLKVAPQVSGPASADGQAQRVLRLLAAGAGVNDQLSSSPPGARSAPPRRRTP